jgi:hypothetical protein
MAFTARQRWDKFKLQSTRGRTLILFMSALRVSQEIWIGPDFLFLRRSSGICQVKCPAGCVVWQFGTYVRKKAVDHGRK